MKRGFTLVEILVVIAVLSVVGVMIITIFTRSLRGSNKAQIISSIKQNGQSVLENIDKTVRNADAVVCVLPVLLSEPPVKLQASGEPPLQSPQTIVVVKDGIYTRYRFVPPSPADLNSTNGLIRQDHPVKQFVRGSSPEREETDSELINRICSPTDLMPEATSLTDTNSQTGVSIDCYDPSAEGCNAKPVFKKDKSAGFKDQVTIKFIAKPGVNAPAAVAGQIDPVTFETTVQLR